MKAFPQFKWMPIEEQYTPMGGMDLRDYFAAKAMQGIITNPSRPDTFDITLASKQSYQIADAMMKAREQ